MAKSSTPEGLDDVWDDWQELVTMTAGELEDWLETDESQSVGQKEGGEDSESTGHAEGRRIVEVLRTNKGDLTDEDVQDMQKVVGYVKRHLAQGGPDDDVEHSRWRYSLMNWGNDPLKK